MVARVRGRGFLPFSPMVTTLPFSTSGRRLRVAFLQVLAVAACHGVAPSTGNAAVPATINVEVNKPGVTIPPSFNGLMTEEINHSYDGGLFAELIQNRTFQDQARIVGKVPSHWSVIGKGIAAAEDIDPVGAALPISLRLDLSAETAGVANDGYWGIPVRPDTTYTASFYAKARGGFNGAVTASLVLDDGGATLVETRTPAISEDWQKYTVTLVTPHDAPTTSMARFALSAAGTGSVSFSLVSLFPPTYQDVPGGLRQDLMKLMADLHPKFIRLPGGNYVEGGRFADRFNWKKMIGPADQRPGHAGCWGYRSSDGFGLPQYLLWCKQLGAEPVLAVFAGYVLNGDYVRGGSPEMEVYTQEALQEIEYVSGPADSEWGKKRAADGFPEPFPLHYVEIGNEDDFDKSGSYDGRFTQMAKAIRQRYPDLKIIATAPVKSFQPDLYDDHMYASAKQTMAQYHRYDPPSANPAAPLQFSGGGWSGRQPDGRPTFVGEWATQEGRPTPDLNAALADAVWLMGLERNADAISMQCYAPLLANVNPEDKAKGYPKAWQWPTNMIGYDALGSYGSPSYHALALFAQNQGDRVLPVTLEVAPTPVAVDLVPHGGAGLGTYHTQVEYKDFSVTLPDGRTLMDADLTKNMGGWQFTGDKWNFAEKSIKPSVSDSESWAITSDPSWTNYTVRVQARKLGGREGFIVLWHATDGDNYRWWNVGGWDNTIVRCESGEEGGRTAYGPAADFEVETGRWYELRLEVEGNRMRGYVDGKLVTDATQQPHEAATALFASATYATADHGLILKVVNAGKEPVDATINLFGVAEVAPRAVINTLTGEPRAVNTIEQPNNVTAKEEPIIDAAASVHRTFPAHSLSVLRLTTLSARPD